MRGVPLKLYERSVRGREGIYMRLTVRLPLLFTGFSLVPMLALGGIGVAATQRVSDGFGTRLTLAAQSVADKIDRNLFERYGDLQAFGLNEAVPNR